MVAREVLETNVYMKTIKMGSIQPIDYHGMKDGRALKGWLLLPVQYEKGKRYPLITYVYAGAIQDEERPSEFLLTRPDSLESLQLLASHGYAVLLPSMPLQPEGVPSDPLLDLTDGVLPAIERAVELGFVDPNRLGVMGHSYGGYSTLGLITQTNRFKAAVALAGPTDLISEYGQFDARTRYSDHPEEMLVQPVLEEISQGRMGGPPWADVGRYLRNSPLFYTERVNTPVMIIQGDLDYVPIQQGEEFFVSLYRQNKRAEFVRYWGEGHGIGSPANVQDMWQRIYGWFDQFLKSGDNSRLSATPQKN
jgi:dipeptidyl aminopeptidase/acylaminoacyl peptidase